MGVRHLRLTHRAAAWIAVLLVGAVAAGGYVWSRYASQPLVPEKLAIGVADVFFTIPVLVAEEQGFFREAGLDATLQHFSSGRAAMEVMFKDRQLDVVTVSDTPLALAALRGEDVTAIGNFTRADNDVKTIAHPGSGIQSVADLRGKRVGTPFGTVTDFCLHVLLTDEGLTMADIDRVDVTYDAAAEALVQQRVDAVATVEPYASFTSAATNQQGVALTSAGRCVARTGYISNRALPRERPEAVRRLLRGTQRAIDWMQKNRPQAVAMVARKLAVDVKVVDALWDSYEFSLSLEQGFLNSLDAQAQWIVDTGLVPPTPLPNFLKFVDLSALLEVNPSGVSIIH